ncbi:hypothetical protein RRG08_038447 [Elysia crispata]|uniref:Sodium/nucleoside cotransporter n=1 Tax=Elysia crispata TaxID=231223 RepID=A0AAE1E1D5_9GAST|nr:hypothetical protein RRG08_038447 [Elysia crispata]
MEMSDLETSCEILMDDATNNTGESSKESPSTDGMRTQIKDQQERTISNNKCGKAEAKQPQNMSSSCDLDNDVTDRSDQPHCTSLDIAASAEESSSVVDSSASVVDNGEPRPQEWKRIVRITLYVAGLVLFFVYFSFAVVMNFDRAVPLIILTSLALLAILWKLVRSWLKPQLLPQSVGQDTDAIQGAQGEAGSEDTRRKSCEVWTNANQVVVTVCNTLGQRRVKMACYILTILAISGFVVSQHLHEPDRLRPLVGLASIVVVSLLVSYDRSKINWRPVIWGMALQMGLGIVTLRTGPGRDCFQYIGSQMESFLDHVLAGVLFVFGDKYQDFFFIFKLMPIVIFLSSVVSILYHVGAMQRLVGLIATAMSFSLGTTAAETTGTAACIFLGQPEASLTIRPFLEQMTRSELFTITTAGFASVTVDVFAIFVHYGMPSSHIITAVLMSAPATIAVAKIICPETEVSQTKDLKQLQAYEKRMVKHRSVLDAAVQGAQDAVGIVVAVVATIIAFLSILSFLNSVIAYLGELVNVEGLSLQMMVAYPLMPVAYILGVAWEDCGPVAEVIGLKTFVNELVGYQRLEEIVQTGAIKHSRSHVIAMYALCGFSNPTTVGVTLAGLSAMVPQKRQVCSIHRSNQVVSETPPSDANTPKSHGNLRISPEEQDGLAI